MYITVMSRREVTVMEQKFTIPIQVRHKTEMDVMEQRFFISIQVIPSRGEVAMGRQSIIVI